MLAWIIFSVLILILLFLDLRLTRVVTAKKSLYLTLIWIAAALLFNLGIYVWRGPADALSFFTGYLIEKSLSLDNLFVFLLIFQYFKLPERYTHKVLLWGVLGAIIFRAAFILLGLWAIELFQPIFYLFGLFLILISIKFFIGKEHAIKEKSWIGFLKTYLPFTDDFVDGHFLVFQKGKLFFTPLLLVLISVELSDILFAIDSIPAIFAITLDPFIVFTSNIFAVIGLRSLYFVLGSLMKLFSYLHYGLGAILFFIGVKMLLHNIAHIPIFISLCVIFSILLLCILASYLSQNKT